MQKKDKTVSRNALLFSIAVVCVAAVLFGFSNSFQTKAGKPIGKSARQKTVSSDQSLPNYDIRADKGAFEKKEYFRQSANKNAADIADIRENFVAGENSLQKRVSNLKIEYNSDSRTPEVISADAGHGRNFLTEYAGKHHAETLRKFIGENSSLTGISSAQADELKVTADYTNPDGKLSFTHLGQFINGIPVFRGEIKAGFTKNGEIVRVINNLAPAVEYQTLSEDFRDPLDAVKTAAQFINVSEDSLSLSRNDEATDNLKTTFGNGDWATTAEKMYFPVEPGVARPAWRVLIWQPVNAFYVIVDAETGAMLWRKNITQDQTQTSTFSVYANPNAMINVADSPFPFTPGPTSPNGQQGAGISRTSVSRTGNEIPYTFNNLGWITDGITKTDGNAVQAGLDRDTVNGIDTNSEASSASRNFTYSYNPFNPNTNTGDSPIPSTQTYPGSQFQQGSVTQMFYISNWYHDELYRLGFTEAAGNFQNNNFGRGGVGSDRISAEGQDSSGTDNANFSTPADGGRGRMQMYVWSGPNPVIDGNLDADVIIHELTHGLSNRLHGNGNGLSSNMADGMGEGWSDFYAHALLSEPNDPLNGVYTTGGYATYLLAGLGTRNYYYGIRRFPKAIMSSTGGPNNRPHNPLTFADIDATQSNTADGAYPAAFVANYADDTHPAGEVWSSALWEIRAKFIARLGWAEGNRKILQYVTDGMKLAPVNPTFLQERDAIVAATLASGTAADVADVWAGFAIRGMGFSAVVNNPGSGNGTARVTEAFDLPNLLQTPNLTVSDSSGNNNGYAEPGETITIAIPLNNITGRDAIGTTLQIVGGGSANYGTIANGQTINRNVSYTVPANSTCGSSITLTINVNSSLGATNFTRTIIIGVPVISLTENFDGVTAPSIPNGWTATTVQSGVNFVTSTFSSDSAPNAVYARDPSSVGGGTDLVSPSINVTAAAATVSFRNLYNTESGWDGGVLEISVNGGAFQDILTAGGRFIENGYNGILGPGKNNPLANRSAWTGFSNGYVNTTVQLPAAASGQPVRLKWRFGADDNTVGQGANPGWYIDGIKFVGNYNCSLATKRVRADFDGDGKSDLSVFRPSEGNWYINGSKTGFTSYNWGLQNDKLTPGDYDGDGKADLAIYRNDTWYIFKTSDFSYTIYNFGLSGDVPVAADYDGDKKTDLAVWRPSSGVWYILKSSDNSLVGYQFGLNGDIPVTGDYDGDGKADYGIYRNGVWYLAQSGGNISISSFGLSADMPVQADYDGDGRDDIAVWRPSDGVWYINNSSNGSVNYVQWGLDNDIPVPGDYDGDGKYDQAIYRNGVWYIRQSSGGFIVTQFGLTNDKPVPKGYIP